MTYMDDDSCESEDDYDQPSEKPKKPGRDWRRLKGFFFAKTNCLNLYCIDFAASTAHDMRQLKLPKGLCGQDLYTASFFCKEYDDWFIYRVILPVGRNIVAVNSPDVLGTLTKKALNIYVHRARTKNPLLYLREIRLD
jgi:hypothetical protein